MPRHPNLYKCFKSVSKCFNNFNTNNRCHLLSIYWMPSTLYAFMSIYMSATWYKRWSHTFSQQFYNNPYMIGSPPPSPFSSYEPHFTDKESEVKRRSKDLNKVTPSVSIRPSAVLACPVWLQLCHVQTKLLVFSSPTQIQFFQTYLGYLSKDQLPEKTLHLTIPSP